MKSFSLSLKDIQSMVSIASIKPWVKICK